MDRARLLSHFDTLADTPDAVAKLRELVLSLAVRGKLVAQSPADESADALVRTTQALAQKIAREERIKLPTPELPIGETDKVFALPVGWAWVKLGSICLKLGAGSTPLGGKQVYEKTGIKFLRSQNIWNEGLHLDDVAFIPASVHADMSATCVRPGDILLNITGASIGRSAVVPDDFDHANVSQHVSIMRLADSALRHFVHLYVIAPDFQKRIMAVQVGVSREGLSMARLKEFVVPLPPLAEQKRIVARVEELLALCDELEARQTAAREQRTRLVQSAFDHLTAARDDSEFRKHSAFCLQHSDLLFDSVPALRQAILSLAIEGRLLPTTAENWKTESLEDVAEAIIDCPHSTPKWTPAGRVCVRTSQFRHGFLDLSESRYVSDSTFQERVERIVPRENDILYSREGGILGVACRVPPNVELCLGQRMMLIRTSSKLTPAYLELVLNSPRITQVAKSETTGGAAPRVNVSTVRSYKIPYPPLAEQQRIVAKVAALMSWCDELEARLAAAQSAAAALLASSLHALLATAV